MWFAAVQAPYKTFLALQQLDPWTSVQLALHDTQVRASGLYHDRNGTTRPQQPQRLIQEAARGCRWQLVAHQTRRDQVGAALRQPRRLRRGMHKCQRLLIPVGCLCATTQGIITQTLSAELTVVGHDQVGDALRQPCCLHRRMR